MKDDEHWAPHDPITRDDWRKLRDVLWRKYRRGDKKALKTLISYNNADIMNLEPLMELAYDEMKSRVFGKKQYEKQESNRAESKR